MLRMKVRSRSGAKKEIVKNKNILSCFTSLTKVAVTCFGFSNKANKAGAAKIKK
jgi:hypothetical protein